MGSLIEEGKLPADLWLEFVSHLMQLIWKQHGMVLGTSCSHSSGTGDILKDKWGFTGFTVRKSYTHA